jgi:Na+/H+-dicarboxylate symporter
MNTSDVSDENKEELSDISSVSPLSDFVFSLFWIALGSLIMLASWQMDRLEGQGSSLYTAPGSYPGLLGGILLILGVDHFLDMARSATNVLGNGLATAVISKWEGELEG